MTESAASGSICCSAPARANLIGNPSDWYGGAVLAASVPLRAHVRLQPAARLGVSGPDGEIEISGPGDLEPRGDSLDLARAALRGVGPGSACRIEYATEIPRQSGLAGSTALLVALIRALLAWRGDHPGPYLLAQRVRQVERELLGVACGWTDAYMCVFGGVQYMDFRGLEWELPAGVAPFATLEPLAEELPRLPFVLAQSGVRHHSGSVHSPLRARWERGERQVVLAYDRLAAIAREGKAAWLRGDWSRVGTLMNENHRLQAGLGGSGEVNDRLIAAALAAGAPGAKLAGAGQGGTICVLWPSGDRAPLDRALRQAGAVRLIEPEPVVGVELDPGSPSPC